MVTACSLEPRTNARNGDCSQEQTKNRRTRLIQVILLLAMIGLLQLYRHSPVSLLTWYVFFTDFFP